VDREELGKFLKKMREMKGLSLRSLEHLSKEKSGHDDKPLTYSHISRVEKGEVNPNIRTLQKFAEALNIPLVVILEGSKVQADTATIVSTTEFSIELIKALHRRELAQLLVFCQNLTDEQISTVLDIARSISNAKQPEGEIKTSQE
jgi:transcriptional regulator with XRE-family HTH domain